MTFTQLQLEALRRPFALDEHDFKSGNVYLKKSAIRRRLDSIDPGWQITVDDKPVKESEGFIVLRGSLTLCGVTRYALGTGVIQRTKKDPDNDKKQIDLTPFEIATNTARAYKAADSDVLPRAALQFNVGAYLKEPPRDKYGKSTITNPAALKDWLVKFPAPASPLPTQWGGVGGGEVRAALPLPDQQRLDELCSKHLNDSLPVVLERLNIHPLEDFAAKHTDFDTARKSIAGALVDQRQAVTVYNAETRTATSGSLYLSLDFGFERVSIFNGAVNTTFAGTTYLLNNWKVAGQMYTFTPPARVLMSRDANGYPRVDLVEQLAADDASH